MAANRGEWAELYVFFKLLGDGKIYAADDNLNRNPNSYLNILRIIREEIRAQIIEYNVTENAIIIITLPGEDPIEVQANQFLINAENLLHVIQNQTGRTFEATEEINTFMQLVRVSRIKAPSMAYNNMLGGKNDIIMEVYDHTTALSTIAGFSIKSNYKSPATLFNAAKASSFVYRLSGMNDARMTEVNSLFNARGNKDKTARISYFINNRINFNFYGVRILAGNDHSIFSDNLQNVRGDMEMILNHALLIHYFELRNSSKLSDITNKLIEENPLSVRRPDIYYKKAIKDFLYAAFAGLTASEVWDGVARVNGGYIVAKDDGEVLVYHTRDGESFRTFLFNNTRIDRPDASENRCDYAYVYKIGNEYYFDLNFQIRFI